jgi:5-methylcytosine-specific restriction protein A
MTALSTERIAAHSFEVGMSYDREEILNFLGSKQPMSGITYGSKNPEFLAVFTGGRFGKRAGYTDGWDADGIFRYCGQGSKGDQRLQGANAILARHDGAVLVFETWKPRNSWKGRQRFVGDFNVLGHETTTARGAREGDQILVYSLVPIPLLGRPLDTVNLASNWEQETDLRARALAASKDIAPVKMSKAEYRVRTAVVARYVLGRAAGFCEACECPVPFCRADGTPFLETHHTRRVADDGPDDIWHVAGICPNCHRQAHFGPDLLNFREQLERKISIKEDALNLLCEQSAT